MDETSNRGMGIKGTTGKSAQVENSKPVNSSGEQKRTSDVKKPKDFPGAPNTSDPAAVLAPDDTFPGSGPNPRGSSY